MFMGLISIVVSDLDSEAKGSQFESDSQKRWGLCSNLPPNVYVSVKRVELVEKN